MSETLNFLNNLHNKITLFHPGPELIYVRCNKAGGTLIASRILFSRLRLRQLIYRGQDEKNVGEDEAPFSGWPVATAGIVSQWDNWFSFSFVRNPWDRLVSCYTYLADQDEKFSRLTFDEFVMDLENLSMQHPVVAYHSAPGHLYTHHDGKQMVDFVGKVESINTDLTSVLDKVGLLNDGDVPRVNASKHGQYREYYNDVTRAKIADLYEQDIDLYGYTF